MRIALPDVLKGKAIQIKGKEYFATKDYVTPFVERMKVAGATDFDCWVKECDQVAVNNGAPDEMFNRVLIQATLPEKVNNYNKAICMTYSLDVRKPNVKFYKGWVDSTNRFYIFSEAFIITSEIEEMTALDYTPVDTLLQTNDQVIEVLQQVQTIESEQATLQQKLGKWIDSVINFCIGNDYSKVKLPTSMPVDVYRMLVIDKDSDYYLQPKDKVSLQKVLEGFLDIIADDDKDITNKAEKAILVGKVLGL